MSSFVTTNPVAPLSTRLPNAALSTPPMDTQHDPLAPRRSVGIPVQMMRVSGGRSTIRPQNYSTGRIPLGCFCGTNGQNATSGLTLGLRPDREATGEVMRHGNALDEDNGGIPDAPWPLGKEEGGDVRRDGEPDHGIDAPLARMAP